MCKTQTISKTQSISTKRMAFTALMAALTCAGSAIRVTMPIQIGDTTSIHLGNIMCALSGILLGPWLGGLAAGLGSAIYDMFNPMYIAEAWMTFLMKGAYGLIPGLIMLLWKKEWKAWQAAVAASGGALAYAALYLLKTYWKSVLVKGYLHEAAMLAVFAKVPSTVFNGVVAIIFAPILAMSIRHALESNHLTLE